MTPYEQIDQLQAENQKLADLNKQQAQRIGELEKELSGFKDYMHDQAQTSFDTDGCYMVEDGCEMPVVYLSDIQAAIDDYTTPAAADVWISVEERPTEGCQVLIASNYGVKTGYYSLWNDKFQDGQSGNDEGMEDWDGNVFEPTHWMPLPAKPAAQGEQK